MSLPTLDKTWSFAVNLSCKEREAYSGAGGHSGPTNQLSYGNILYAIKEQLVAWGWTVERSSDAYSAGASDNWTSYLSLAWQESTAYGSWVVLKKTNAAGAGKDLYLLLTCLLDPGASSSPYYLGVFASYSAFTGGSTTVRPTSPGEKLVMRPAFANIGGWWIMEPSWFTPTWPPTNRGPDAVLHAMRSTDGECERFVIVINNVVAGYLAIERIKNPTTGMTHPLAITATGDSYNNNGGVLSFPVMNRGGYMGNLTGTQPHTFFFNNGLWGDAYWGAESHVASCLGERIPYANEIDGGYVMCPVSLISNTPQLKGHHGFLYDIWWGSIEMRTGDTYPGDETAQFVKFTDVVLPWDGSTPLLV
jgi:hypothetical protein